MAHDELIALGAQVDQAKKDLDALTEDIVALQTRASERRLIQDRLEREALRLVDLPPATIPRLSEPQRDALEELRALQTSLHDAHGRLSERAETLARLSEAVGAKQAYLARLRDRARTLAAVAAFGDTAARAAQVAVLSALAWEATETQTALAQLVAAAMVQDGAASAWSLPVRGPITLAFGPTTFELEPPERYRGVYYPHFHGAVDIAAPLGAPVAAASDGAVTFVGHLPDGAMIVLIAHAGGYVSAYAHLDDTFASPLVRAGQSVKAGEVIGFVGLTGVTTGPHLHFIVNRAGEPIDPLPLIAGGT